MPESAGCEFEQLDTVNVRQRGICVRRDVELALESESVTEQQQTV